MVIHDKNENNKMDYDINGKPKVAYGASNNNISFDLPKFNNIYNLTLKLINKL